jgi:hypothetical protein
MTNWKDGEFEYCQELIATRGNADVTHDPKTIAAYLRLQASCAFGDGEFEIAARLGDAATSINCDAPDWNRASISVERST